MSLKLTLERFCYSQHATFGYIGMPDGQVLATVERPWLDNKPMVSCIPTGYYSCAPKFYNRGGYQAVEVLNVPNRSHILFHIGNYARDSNGCILINSRHGANGDEWCGRDSGTAFVDFMKQVGGEPFSITIKNIEAGHGGFTLN